MSAAPVKFAFDLDLGHRQERNSVVTETAMASALDKARAEGLQLGLAQGEQAATAKAAAALAKAAEQLAAKVGAMSAGLDDHKRATLADAIDLSAAIGRKLASHLLGKFPTGEIEALVAECMASLDGVPHLVIRCTPELADAVRDIATVRMEISGFAGRLVVLGDPDLGIGDTRIEWVDGGLVRDRAALEAEIDTRISAFLAVRGTPGGSR